MKLAELLLINKLNNHLLEKLKLGMFFNTVNDIILTIYNKILIYFKSSIAKGQELFILVLVQQNNML